MFDMFYQIHISFLRAYFLKMKKKRLIITELFLCKVFV